MWILLLLLITGGTIIYITTAFYRKGDMKSSPSKESSAIQCCGTHSICEKETLLVTKDKIEYYDDEELDAYIDINPKNYDKKALLLFENVFYSLAEGDIPGWTKSLHLRKIELPDDIKEQVFLILTERRN